MCRADPQCRRGLRHWRRLLERVCYCCGFDQKCKVYELPTRKNWKRLYFLDECAVCGQPIASLQECGINGQIKILKRVSGKAAVKLRDTIALKKAYFDNLKTGSYSNELILFNNRGIVFNFNNRRVGVNEDFITV